MRSPASVLSPNATGSLYMTLGSLGYVVNDAFIRAAVDEGLDVYQALFTRGVAMTLLFATLGRARGEQLSRSHVRGALPVRVGAEVMGTVLFFAALVNLDFANAQTILLVVPFAVTLVAARWFGETVSTRQYAAVALGFLGVVAVIRPATSAFSGWSLVVVAAAACLVVREFATLRVPDETPALAIATLTAVAVTAVMGVISVFRGWGDLTPRAVLLLALACLCLTAGYLFTIETVRVGDLSVSAPFRYTTLLGAVVIGTAVFDEPLDALTVAGCTIIVIAGFWAIRLDHHQQLAPPTLPITPRGNG